MQRREFITLLSGAAVAWPLAARAQQPAMPVIGILSSESPAVTASEIAAFRRGLSETDYVEGKNVAIEYRWAEGQNDRLPALAADLVGRKVAVIAAAAGTPPAVAAKAATTQIPIVFGIGTDPIAFGLVTSLNRPGGNLTGVTALFDEVAPKRLELIHELVPAATIIALLVNPTNPNAETQSIDLRQAVRKLGLQLHVLFARAERDLHTVFETVSQLRVGALLIGGDAFFIGQRDMLVALAASHAIPAIYFDRLFVVAGGLMSYGGSLTEMFRLIGVYTGRILKGENRPICRSSKPRRLIWSSISRRPRHSASPSQSRYSAVPTR
jgi:putative tryptophan/tyrosine transport system substrate-binding protein